MSLLGKAFESAGGTVLGLVTVGVLGLNAALPWLVERMDGALAALRWIWPVAVWLPIAATAWVLIARLGGAGDGGRRGFWLTAARQTIAPITFGLAAVALAVIALDVSHHLFAPASVRQVELWLIRAKLELKEANDSLPIFFGLLAGALAISLLLPRWRALAALDWLRTAATATYVFLVTVTSFTLFSQTPLQQLLADDASNASLRTASAIRVYHLLKRRRQDAVEKYLAATIVKRDIEHLDPSARQALARRLQSAAAAAAELTANLISELHCVPPAPSALSAAEAAKVSRCDQVLRSAAATWVSNDVSDRMGRRLAAADWHSPPGQASESTASPPPEPRPARVALADAEPPASVAKWQQRLRSQQALVDRNAALRESVKNAENAESKGFTAARMALAELVGSVLPDAGLIGSYLAAAVDKLVEVVYKPLAAWYARVRPGAPLDQLPLPAGRALGGEHFGGDPAAGAVEDPEVRKIAEEVRQELRVELEREVRAPDRISTPAEIGKDRPRNLQSSGADWLKERADREGREAEHLEPPP